MHRVAGDRRGEASRVMIGEQVECGGGTVLIRRKAAINN